MVSEKGKPLHQKEQVKFVIGAGYLNYLINRERSLLIEYRNNGLRQHQPVFFLLAARFPCKASCVRLPSPLPFAVSAGRS